MSVRTLLVGVAVVATVLVSALIYLRVGWDRMESHCIATPRGSESPAHSSVQFSWTWMPLGFTCTYEDDSTETSLWF